MKLRTTFSCLNVYLLAGALFVAGCTQKWFLIVERADDFGPTFCLSHHSICDDTGIQINMISVRRVALGGGTISTAWLLQGQSNNPADYLVHELKYGVVPRGWNQLSPATPIEAGAYYSLNDEFYFTRDVENRYSVFTRSEFFEKH
jgi:hypothetical protein